MGEGNPLRRRFVVQQASTGCEKHRKERGGGKGTKEIWYGIQQGYIDDRSGFGDIDLPFARQQFRFVVLRVVIDIAIDVFCGGAPSGEKAKAGCLWPRKDHG